MAEVHHPTVLDTGAQKLGAVYAKALVGATEKAGNTDEVLGQLRSLIHDVFDRLPQFEATLNSPRVPFETKESLLDRAFQKRIPSSLLTFLKVLARRNRFTALRAVEVAARKVVND